VVWWSWWVRCKTKRFCDNRVLREAVRWNSITALRTREAALETALDATGRCPRCLFDARERTMGGCLVSDEASLSRMLADVW
jgi:hypothetical protein